jgi:hypothetical protein
MGGAMSIVLAGSTSGTITLQEPAVAGTNTISLPASTGTVALTSQLPVAGPAFSAFPTTVTTSIPQATFTSPIAVDTKQFDTDSCFNATGSTVNGIPAYAFKPTTAGYYQINACVNWSGGGGGANYLAILKNGTEFLDGPYFYQTGSTAVIINTLLLLNGTTDYIQLGVYQNSGSTRTTSTGVIQFYFQGFLARSA